MQILSRLFNRKGDKPIESNIVENKDIKWFLVFKRYYKKSKKSDIVEKQQQDQELLLTQCIETALFPPIVQESVPHRRTISFSAEPIKQPQRQRKLSLPPQLVNIGYLASIPEVDSQVALNNQL